jgi:hypothetical protein
MILSYSLDVRPVPLNILFFNFDVFIFKLYHTVYDFFSVTYNPDSGTEFIRNTLRLWEKRHIFYFIFILYAYWIFVKHQTSTFKYEIITLKQNVCQAEVV